ncbi:MAG: hypothetical protein AAGJ83_08665, partial [Planctomycetota bacterium]
MKTKLLNRKLAALPVLLAATLCISETATAQFDLGKIVNGARRGGASGSRSSSNSSVIQSLPFMNSSRNATRGGRSNGITNAVMPQNRSNGNPRTTAPALWNGPGNARKATGGIGFGANGPQLNLGRGNANVSIDANGGVGVG